MTGEIFSAESFFWSCLWQSTIFLVAGLLGSFLLRRHSARAHRVLFLAMTAAVIVPAASILVKHYELGIFVAKSAVIQPPVYERAIYETTGIVANEAIERGPNPINEDLYSATAVSETAKFPWRSTLIYGWIAASLIFVARLLVTFVLGVRLLRRAKPLNNNKIEQAIRLAKLKLGINKDVKIYGSANIQSPVIWCWRRRPVLLVPSKVSRAENGIDWAGVLCHELAHYKRRDHVAGLLAELTVCFLPWHPLLWWAKYHLISLSEQACDDWVIASGRPGTDYAESLLNLTPEGQMAFVPAVVSSKKGLAGRVRRILKDSCGNPRTGIKWALAMSLVAACLIVGIAFAQTRPAKTEIAIATEMKPTESLHKAAASGDVQTEQIRSLIAKGADVNERGEKGRTPLHHAVLSHTQSIGVVELLIEKGADVNAEDSDGRTPLDIAMDLDRHKTFALLASKIRNMSLHNAAFVGDLKEVKNLIKNTAEVNTKDLNGKTALHYAARRSHVNVIEALLAGDARLDEKDNNGDTALHHAAMSGNRKVIALLLAKGATVNARNANGGTPIESHIRLRPKREIIDLFIKNGADTSSIYVAAYLGDLATVKDLVEKDKSAAIAAVNGWTPLHTATWAGNRLVAEFLISKGANVNAHAEAGFTPLAYAASEGHKEIVNLLIDKGANVNADYTGVQGALLGGHNEIVELLLAAGSDAKAIGDAGNLHLAGMVNNLEVARLLIRHGVAVDVKWLDRTALYHAVTDGREEFCRLLVAEGADINAKNTGDWTPLHAACAYNYKDKVEFFLVAGADVNARNADGKTPLVLAKERGHTEIVELLKKHRAKEESPADSKESKAATPLHEAAAYGDIEQIKRLIAEGADINAKDGRDNTPLSRAVKSGNMEVIQLLVKTGADVNAGNWPPLCVAVDEDNIPIAKYLIDNGANIDIPEGWTALQEAPYADTRSLDMIKLLIAKGGDVNAGPYTALHGAVDKNRQDMIELLLQNGADINAKAAKRGMTPLCLAARFYNLDMIKFLIAKGADPSIADEGGFLPLHWAASRGEKDMLDLLLSKGNYASSICAAACKGDLNRVKSLIEAGTSINDKDEGGWTPLHWAGLAESPEMADFLLARGADVNAGAGHGFTPLRIARSLPVIELLISKGADINSQDTDLGLTKLHEVCGSGRRDVAELLIARGANVNAKPAKGGMYGRTPLHFAAIYGHRDIVKLLISKGADIHAVCPWRSDHRQTALHLAARTGHAEVVEYLLAEGLDVNVQDSKGQTALDLAERQNHSEVVELLKKHGAKESAQATQYQGPVKESQKNEPSIEMAINSNNIEKVKELIAQGANINAQDSRGNPPLHQAIIVGKLSFVEMLISAGTDMNAKNRRGQTPLGLAKRRGNIELVKILTKAVEEQTTVEKKPSKDEPPADSKESKALVEAALSGDLEEVKRLIAEGAESLHEAAAAGDIEQVKRLIAQGADINAKDRRGFTPLFSAIGNRDNEMLKLLVNEGADVNVSTNDGVTPLDNAVWGKDVKIVEYLLDEGADINLKGYRGFTAFRNAANAGHREVVDLLVSKGVDISNIHGAACIGDVVQVRSYLSQGVDVDQKDELGWTPLVWAVSMSQEDVVEVLLAHGAEAKMKTEDGIVPLCEAATKSKRIIELLISHGADVNVMDGRGSTPLYWAAMYNNLDGVKLFLKNGAEIDVRSKTSGFTPLHRASQWGHPEIVQILISGGADVNIKTKNGGTPLHTVLGQRNRRQLKGHDEVAELLLESGADLNAKDNRGRTPLDMAKQFGHTEIVEMLTKAAQKQTSAEKKPSDDESPAESKEPKPVKSLVEAALSGDLEEVKRLIAEGADVNATDPEIPEVKFTPVMAAANRGHADVMQVLLENGAEVNSTDFQGWTALYYAFWIYPDEDNEAKHRERAEVVKALIASGADVNKQCQGASPLINAITTGTPRLGSVEALLDGGADIHFKDNHGLTPLYWAAFAGNRNVLDLIIERGNYPETIHLTACRGDLNRVKAFIEEGINVNTRDEFGCTPLHWAGLAESSEVARFLIDKGADVNAKDAQNMTPLLAARGLALIKLLVSRGADIQAQDGLQGRGPTKLHMACSNGDKEVAEFLIDQGADINARNKRRATPLWVAAGGNHKEIVKLLLEKGADINAIDRRRRSTPLWVAVYNDNKETVKLLIEKGANINTPDNQGRTPLTLARQRGHIEIAELLEKHGANGEPPAGPKEPKPAKSLYDAAIDGDIDEVKRLIAQGMNVNAMDQYKNLTPLGGAAMKGQSEVVKVLLEHGADIELGDTHDYSPLYYAIWSSDEETIKTLIAGGANVNVHPNEKDFPPLPYAIFDCRNTNVVKALLDAGARLDVADEYGQTPLYWAAFASTPEIFELVVTKGKYPTTIHLAAYNGNELKVREFIKEGTDVNAGDKFGCTPLQWAAVGGANNVARFLVEIGANVNTSGTNDRQPPPLAVARGLDMVKFLISKGAEVNAQIKGSNRTRLHLACAEGQEDIAQFLISKGADVNVKAAAGTWPLHLAASGGHKNIVKLLLDNGANVNAVNSIGRSALERAKEKQYTEIVELLRKHGAEETLHGAVASGNIDEVKRLISLGADVNSKNQNGQTPLFLAVRNGLVSIQIAELLIAKGAEVNSKNMRNRTPLHMAAMANHNRFIELLIAKGADINAKDRDGKTPLSMAEERGNKAMAELLRKLGAKE